MRRKISIMMVRTSFQLLSKDNQVLLQLIDIWSLLQYIEAIFKSKRLLIIILLVHYFYFLLCLIPVSGPSFSYWKLQQPPNHNKWTNPVILLAGIVKITERPNLCACFILSETSPHCSLILFLSVNFLAFF